MQVIERHEHKLHINQLDYVKISSRLKELAWQDQYSATARTGAASFGFRSVVCSFFNSIKRCHSF